MYTRPLMTNQKGSQDKEFQLTKFTSCKLHITDNKLQITITRGCDKAPQTNNYKVCPSHFTHFSIDPNELSLYAQLLQIFDAFSDHGQMMEAIG